MIDGFDVTFEWIMGLSMINFVLFIVSLVLFRQTLNVRRRLRDISETLDDIVQGNNNRKLLAKPREVTSTICYQINEIVDGFRKQLINHKKAEEANKQLMTSLSHDVRTPLTTLIGYLDAVQKGIVSGVERQTYIETARRRAYEMKDYVDQLFEWFKLHEGEETFTIQNVELAELTRNLLKDWIPIFEESSLHYEIEIPEQLVVALDHHAYFRILNNLIQNVMSHSQATRIRINVSVVDDRVDVMVSDNGVGIPEQDLPHIFERLYKCDKVRSKKGSGLGLAIVQDLVEKMRGTIQVNSEPSKQTEFRIQFPLSRKIPAE